MKTQPKKLTLHRETLRDLTAHDAREVKGGMKGGKQKDHYTKGKCIPTLDCPTFNCGSQFCW